MSENKGNTIGEKLSTHLQNINMSPIELAKELGVSSQYVYNVLNGKQLGRNAAEKWSKVLNVKPNWLLTGDGPMCNDDTLKYYVRPEIYTDAQLDEIVENRLAARILELIKSGLYVTKEEYDRAIKKEDRLLGIMESQQRTIEEFAKKRIAEVAPAVAPKAAQG